MNLNYKVSELCGNWKFAYYCCGLVYTLTMTSSGGLVSGSLNIVIIVIIVATGTRS